MRKPESNDLDALLAAQTPDARASILGELLRGHYDAGDPLFKLLRVLKLALDVSDQTIKVGDQIPLRLNDVLSEIDKRFRFYVTQWRGLPPEMLATFRGALLAIIPEINDKAKAMALASAANQLDDLAEARRSMLNEFEEQLHSAALTVMRNVSQNTAEKVRIDKTRLTLGTRFTTLLFALGLSSAGAFGGYGWAQSHLAYPPSVQKNIEAGEQYRAMYPHMPAAMQAWIKRWMAAQ